MEPRMEVGEPWLMLSGQPWGTTWGSEANGLRPTAPLHCIHWLAWYLFCTVQVGPSVQSEEKVTLQVCIPVETTPMKSH